MGCVEICRPRCRLLSGLGTADLRPRLKQMSPFGLEPLRRNGPWSTAHIYVTQVTAFPPARWSHWVGDVRYPIRITADTFCRHVDRIVRRTQWRTKKQTWLAPELAITQSWNVCFRRITARCCHLKKPRGQSSR